MSEHTEPATEAGTRHPTSAYDAGYAQAHDAGYAQAERDIAAWLYCEAINRSASRHGNVWSVIGQNIAASIRRGEYKTPTGKGNT